MNGLVADQRTSKAVLLGWALHATGLVALVACGLAAYAAVYRPLAERREACAGRIDELEKLVRRSDEVRREHQDLARSLAELETRAASLRHRLPDGPNESEFLKEVTDAAKASNVVLRNYRPGAVTTVGDYSRMDVQLQCAGDYAGLCRFLDRMARMERLYRLENLSISGDPASGTYPMDITLGLYYEAPGKAGAEGGKSS